MGNQVDGKAGRKESRFKGKQVERKAGRKENYTYHFLIHENINPFSPVSVEPFKPCYHRRR